MSQEQTQEALRRLRLKDSFGSWFTLVSAYEKVPNHTVYQFIQEAYVKLRNGVDSRITSYGFKIAQVQGALNTVSELQDEQRQLLTQFKPNLWGFVKGVSQRHFESGMIEATIEMTLPNPEELRVLGDEASDIKVVSSWFNSYIKPVTCEKLQEFERANPKLFEDKARYSEAIRDA